MKEPRETVSANSTNTINTTSIAPAGDIPSETSDGISTPCTDTVHPKNTNTLTPVNSTNSKRNIRQWTGDSISELSNRINENIIAARYITMFSIGALTVWGVSCSPLFFRYKRLADIPSTVFTNRRTLACRIIDIGILHPHGKQQLTSSTTDLTKPIILWVRHLSPAVRFLPLFLYEKIYPSPTNYQLQRQQQEQRYSNDLIPIEIAGIGIPPLLDVQQGKNERNHHSFLDSSSLLSLSSLQQQSHQSGMNLNEWLQRLVHEKTLVFCTFLGCRCHVHPTKQEREAEGSRQRDTNSPSTWIRHHSALPISTGLNIINTSETKRRKNGNDASANPMITSFQHDAFSENSISITMQPLALCHVKKHPSPIKFSSLLFRRQDIATSLVRNGQACALPSGIHMDIPSFPVLHKSTKLEHIQSDARFVDTISQNEYEAAKQSLGIWSIQKFRDARPDVMKEIDHDQKANIFQKIWRRLF